MISKDKKKAIEKILTVYNSVPKRIKLIDIDIKNIENEFNLYGTVDLSICRSGTGISTYSSVESCLIEKEKRIEELTAKKEYYKALKDKIDLLVEDFTEDERTIFQLRYVENANWLRIISDMHIGKDTYYKLLNLIILYIYEVFSDEEIYKYNNLR